MFYNTEHSFIRQTLAVKRFDMFLTFLQYIVICYTTLVIGFYYYDPEILAVFITSSLTMIKKLTFFDLLLMYF